MHGESRVPAATPQPLDEPGGCWPCLLGAQCSLCWDYLFPMGCCLPDCGKKGIATPSLVAPKLP